MFILFFLLSSAWCGKIFTHAASPVLMNMESSARGEINTVAGVVLPPLPYAYKALEPHLGEETLRIHHDKHHAKVSKLTRILIVCHNVCKICFLT
jgi:hypothetical protein